MKTIISLAGILLLAGCVQWYHAFTPSGDVHFEPRTTEVAVLEKEPSQAFDVIGYVEARQETLDRALPMLKKDAAAHGGDAILHIENTTMGYGVTLYHAKVIRYAPASP
jgi:hypothetical protein